MPPPPTLGVVAATPPPAGQHEHVGHGQPIGDGKKAKTSRKSPLRFVLPVMFIGGFATVGYFGYQSLTADSTTDTDPSAPASTETLGEDPTDQVPDPAAEPVAPIVEPIDDAADVIDDINDNAGEDEAVEIITSGTRGEPSVTEVPFEAPDKLGADANVSLIAGDIIADDLAIVTGAPTFSYRFQRGADSTAQVVFVDATTSNRELFDGVSYVRSVDGLLFGTTDPTGTWAPLPDGLITDPMLALSGLITIDQVLPDDMIEAATNFVTAGDAGFGRYVFTEADLAALPQEVSAPWAELLGIGPIVTPTPAEGFLDEVPDQARPGEVLISVSGGSDGTVTRLVIDAPTLGGFFDYELLGASMEPVVIPTPPVEG